MNNIIRVLILAIIGGLIGYITNVIAIKLIFRPINPIKVPIFNIEIIGMIPKRKKEIAINIGRIVEEQFLSIDEITNNLVTEQDKEYIIDYIKVKIKLILNEKMVLIPSTIRSLVQNYISEIIEDEVREGIDELCEEMIAKASNRINIKEIIENKINELDLYELEIIILQIVKNELRHIEILGLILGFFIGIVQGIITIFI
ncbi:MULTISPECIES: DUF445 domain-containing protein [Romboutsia]|jgi:uncharacterized membrane protein YheB (UPF0754 family)|uniref:DUF445 domain-containing protein n=1 Tax=Romboutsia TaxID=1501226 RepID=UPI002172FDBB|nr:MULTISPECIES: DUF445 family protein [Romboutsia]MCI9060895.1 DUF445 family protein [Romboutsia sp.]MCI9258630.1 DUF445 family protein [Romboutsia sp.]